MGGKSSIIAGVTEMCYFLFFLIFVIISSKDII